MREWIEWINWLQHLKPIKTPFVWITKTLDSDCGLTAVGLDLEPGDRLSPGSQATIPLPAGSLQRQHSPFSATRFGVSERVVDVWSIYISIETTSVEQYFTLRLLFLFLSFFFNLLDCDSVMSTLILELSGGAGEKPCSLGGVQDDQGGCKLHR